MSHGVRFGSEGQDHEEAVQGEQMQKRKQVQRDTGGSNWKNAFKIF